MLTKEFFSQSVFVNIGGAKLIDQYRIVCAFLENSHRQATFFLKKARFGPRYQKLSASKIFALSFQIS